MLHAVLHSISIKYKAILPLFTTFYHIVNKLYHFTTTQENWMKKKLNTNHTSELYIFGIIY
tara:strand:+ start:537 stop:719 length:183 start_codon:yes stop_codon:yes gene_type:complete